MKGSLEFDPRLMPEENFLYPFSEDQVVISVIFPSREFQAENNEFKKRHESMQAEADEHYKLLVEMQIQDPLFDKMLLDNHNRKRKVEKILGDSRNWQAFISKVSPSMNY